jgi:hypothetical protein
MPVASHVSGVANVVAAQRQIVLANHRVAHSSADGAPIGHLHIKSAKDKAAAALDRYHEAYAKMYPLSTDDRYGEKRLERVQTPAGVKILAAIKVLSQEAHTYTGALAYGPNHGDFLALSRVVSALSANRTAFGYRAPSGSPRYKPNGY